MKALLLSTALLFSSLISVAQHYKITPSREVTVVPEFNELSITDIWQNNTSTDTIHLKWKLISNKLFPGWDFALCDYTTCYAGLPDEGTMTPVPPGERGFLGLNVNPYAIEGTGIVKIFVYEEGFMDKGDTLTWYVNASPTGITKLKQSVNISMYPNPASETVTVQVDTADLSEAYLEITDLIGKVMIRKPIVGTSTELNIADLANGYYLIQYQSGHEITGMKKLCVAR